MNKTLNIIPEPQFGFKQKNTKDKIQYLLNNTLVPQKEVGPKNVVLFLQRQLMNLSAEMECREMVGLKPFFQVEDYSTGNMRIKIWVRTFNLFGRHLEDLHFEFR